MPGAFTKHTLLSFLIASSVFMVGAIYFSVAYAQEPKTVSMRVDGGYRLIQSQGIPHHAAKFLKSSGIKSQSYSFRVNAKPKQAGKVTAWAPGMFFGVALDGVPFSLAARRIWNGNTDWIERYSQDLVDRKGGLKLENDAYVYAGVPIALVKKDLSHVGYAADGFPVFVSKSDKFKSSYRLKKGERPKPPKGPGGAFQGSYIADYQYVSGSGHLDQCNGVLVKKKYYIYILTKEFPYVPLCWTGTPDTSFTTNVDVPEVGSVLLDRPQGGQKDNVDAMRYAR